MRLLGEKPIYISFYDEKNEFFFFFLKIQI